MKHIYQNLFQLNHVAFLSAPLRPNDAETKGLGVAAGVANQWIRWYTWHGYAIHVVMDIWATNLRAALEPVGFQGFEIRWSKMKSWCFCIDSSFRAFGLLKLPTCPPDSHAHPSRTGMEIASSQGSKGRFWRIKPFMFVHGHHIQII